MKLLALYLLLGFAAAASTEWKWEPSKEYRFRYAGRTLTGLPGLSTQQSGFGINCTVVLKVKTPTQLHMTLEEPQFVRIDQEMGSFDDKSTYQDTNNWRRLVLPQMEQVPEEYKKILNQPVVFSLTGSGETVKITVTKHEPEWSVNYKKAIVALFQAKLDVSSAWKPEENKIGTEPSTQWTVEEETIVGKCEAVYRVNELPEWMIVENPSVVPYPEACSERKYFEITRTVNGDKCEKLSTFAHVQPGRLHCNSETMANCGDTASRTSTTRYIACGSRRQQLSIQSIVNDAEFSAKVTGYHTEKIVSGSLQSLRLQEVKPVSGNFPEPSDPVVLNDLMYEYGKEWYGRQQPSDGRIPKSEISGKSISKVSPRTFLPGLLGGNGPSQSQVENQIKIMLQEVTTEVVSEKSPADTSITMKLLSISRGITMLEDKSAIASLYNSLGQDSSVETATKKQFFIDAAAMSGTPQALSFMKEMIMQKKLPMSQVIQFFLWLPHYVFTPTQEVLNELFELATSEPIKKNTTVYSVAITGFAQLVQSACLSQSRKSHYPTGVFGEFCGPESEIVQNKLIPYLVRESSRSSQPKEALRNIHITTLGLLRHKKVISELVPILEGSTEYQPTSTSLRRVLAAYSLASVAPFDPYLVTPVLMSVFANPAESTELRIICFNALLKLNPPPHVFQAIAAATQQEPAMDMELLKTINIALYSLGYEAKLDSSLSEKARATYGLIRKTYGIIPSSGNWYKTEFLKQLDLAYMANFKWIASQESVLPKSAFVKLKYFFSKYYVNVIDLGYRMKGTDAIYNKLSEVLGSHSVKEQLKKEFNSEWNNIMEKLQLKARESDSSAEFAFFLRLFDSGILFGSFGEETVEKMHEKVSSLIRNPRSFYEKLQGESNFNIQKTFDMSPLEYLVPNDMGFPIIAEVHAPVTFSVNGQINLDTQKAVPSFSVTGKALFASQFTGWVGTILPFTQEYLVTGINQHAHIQIPGTIAFKLNVPEHKVSLSVRPSGASGLTDIFRYEVLPYTVHDKISNLKPFTESQNLKPIASEMECKEDSYHFGDFFGLSLLVKAKSESKFTDFKSFLNILNMYNGSPISMLLFGNTSPALSERMTPSIRRHKYTISFNPSESVTKEISMEFKVGFASKREGEEVHYHLLESGNEADRAGQAVCGGFLTVNSLIEKITPYKICSKPIGSHGGHQRRQNNLKNSMQSLDTESATGITILYNLILKGSRPRTLMYAMTSTFGRKHEGSRKIQQKWDVRLESSQGESTIKKICVMGKLDDPLFPMWNVDDLSTGLIHFYNKIGMGSASCEEAQVIVHGDARTSSRQKSYSLKSSEAKLCQKWNEQGIKGSNLSPVCEIVRQQASALDEVAFTIDYVNVPTIVKTLEKKAIVALKGYLWPYFRPGNPSFSAPVSGSSYQTLTRIVFKQSTPSYDMTINTPDEHIVFNNIHIQPPYSLFFPLKTSRNNFALALEKLSGAPVSPTCKVAPNTLITYANRTMSYNPGKCYFLLTAECTPPRRFTVSIHSLGGDKKQVKVNFGERTEVILKATSNGQGPTIEVNKQHLEVPVGKTVPIKGKGQSTSIGTATRTTDKVLVIRAPNLMLNELTTDGEHVSVSPNPSVGKNLCGFCGNWNGQNNCIYSRPELEVARYRIPSATCPPMSEIIKNELIKENEQCSKYEIIPTKVRSILRFI